MITKRFNDESKDKKWLNYTLRDKYLGVKPIMPYEQHAIRRIEKGEDYDKVYLDFLSSSYLAGVPSSESFEEWFLPTLWDKRRIKYFITLTFNRNNFKSLKGEHIPLNSKRITALMQDPIHELKKDWHFIILPEVLNQKIDSQDNLRFEKMVHYHGIAWKRNLSTRAKGKDISIEEWNENWKYKRGHSWLKAIQPGQNRKVLNYVTKNFNQNGNYNDMPFYINHKDSDRNKCCQSCFDNKPTYRVEKMFKQSGLSFENFKKDPKILDYEGSWILTELNKEDDDS